MKLTEQYETCKYVCLSIGKQLLQRVVTMDYALLSYTFEYFRPDVIFF